MLIFLHSIDFILLINAPNELELDVSAPGEDILAACEPVQVSFDILYKMFFLGVLEFEHKKKWLKISILTKKQKKNGLNF
jgi:hypothetical protein